MLTNLPDITPPLTWALAEAALQQPFLRVSFVITSSLQIQLRTSPQSYGSWKATSFQLFSKDWGPLWTRHPVHLLD